MLNEYSYTLKHVCYLHSSVDIEAIDALLKEWIVLTFSGALVTGYLDC